MEPCAIKVGRNPKKLVLLFPKLAPGDSTVITGLIRDIALSRPGEFAIDIVANFPDIFKHNPYITPLGKDKKSREGVQYQTVSYRKGLKDQRYESTHFLSYLHRDFGIRTGMHIPVTKPYPDLHLTPEEKSTKLVDGRYWVVVPGWKTDATVKMWHHTYWAETLHRLTAHGLRCVQIGKEAKDCLNPTMDRTLNLVGRTSLRELMQLIYHSDGVICGVTCAMHMAAALQKPCVVLGGGREAWWWEAYVRENKGLGPPELTNQLTVPHRYLHTIGLLDCCADHGCWKNKVPGLPTRGDKALCKRPVPLPDHPTAECMAMITPAMVETAVLSYYLDGTVMPESGTPLAKETAHVREGLPWRSQTSLISQSAPTLPIDGVTVLRSQ